MFGFDSRAARIAWTVVVVALGLWVLYLVRKTLFVFALALFVAYMIAPLVRWLDRHRSRRLPHGASVAAAFALVIAAIVIASAWIGPMIAEQSSQLTEQLPKLVQKVQSGRLWLPDMLEPWRERITGFAQQTVEGATRSAVPFAQRVVQTAAGIASNAVYLVIIPIVAFLFLKDGERMRRAALQWLAPLIDTTMVSEMLVDLHEALGRYVRALGLMSLATLAAYSIFLTVIGVPFGLLLAAIGALLEFIPVIGPLTAAAIAVLVAVVAGYEHLLWMVGFFIGYRIFQDYVLGPKLMSGGVDVHPALVIFGFLAGEELAGIPGMFLSVPVIATLAIILRSTGAHRRKTVQRKA